MFKWIKQVGCNCHPISDGCERYWLNVGDIWQGKVESSPAATKPCVIWSAEYWVCGKKESAVGGGGQTRDEGMAFVEGRITEAARQVWDILQGSHREIYDALCEFERDADGKMTGKSLQQRLE